MTGLCRVHVTLDTHTGLPEILNHNEQSTPPLGAYIYIYIYIYIYTKLQTQ
jgi:hypothetical protein